VHLDKPVDQDGPHLLVDIFLPLHVCVRADIIVVAWEGLGLPQPGENVTGILSACLRVLHIWEINRVQCCIVVLFELLLECLETLGLVV